MAFTGKTGKDRDNIGKISGKNQQLAITNRGFFLPYP
jgi:hypothetical protein